MQRKLIIVCGGPTTTSRNVHLQKITSIVGTMFVKTVVISEDNGIVVLNRNECWVTAKRKRVSRPQVNSFFLRLIEFTKHEFRKSHLVLSYTSKSDVVLFLGIYQPLALLVAKLRRGFPILFGGGSI